MDATAVKVDEPTTTARLKKPPVTGKNIGALQIAVSVIGPIELFKSYVANATLAVLSISKPRVTSAKPPLAAEGGDWEEKTSAPGLVNVAGGPPFTLTVAVPKFSKSGDAPVT